MNKMKQNDIMKAIDKLRFHYVTIIDLFGRKERAKKSPADNRWGFVFRVNPFTISRMSFINALHFGWYI